MEKGNELLQELLKTGIDEFKKSREKDTETENVVSETGLSLLEQKTELSLLEQKKAIAKRYIDKKINDPILQLTWVAEDYLITENFIDKIKDKLLYEKFLEKSNIEAKTIDEMKNLKNALENVKEDNTQEKKLKNIEDTFIDNIDPTQEKPDQEESLPQKETEEKTEEKPEEISGNFDTLPETYKTYITKISSKFPDPKKTHIIKFWPIVVQEALKHKETKKLIDKIFAQINKESWRNPNALNDKWEYSIGFMQINKNAGHTGKINGKFYDLNKPDGNIAYGISFLAECIRRSNGNIRRWFNIYNGWANLSKPEEKQYAHTIMNDKLFNEKLAA